jgi:ferredoxin--NADP+ reductase
MGSRTDSNAVVLPKASMNVVHSRTPVTGRVLSNDSCLKGPSASFVKHTVIDVGGTPLEASFLAGQSFGVIPPGEDADGTPHKVRLYSFACPSYGEDGAGRIISTTPKRLIAETTDRAHPRSVEYQRLFLGVCSNYLCGLRSGDRVKLTGPSGKRFLLPLQRDEHDYLFLATGTGIAPYRGMVKELMEHPAGPTSRQVHLIMGAPYTTDLLYDELFSRLAREHQNFHYHTAISRERRPNGAHGLRVYQLIDERIDYFAPLLESERTLLYVCGIAGMQTGLYRTLARHGLGRGYFGVKERLAGVDPKDWKTADVRRGIRPTPRCMVEVY